MEQRGDVLDAVDRHFGTLIRYYRWYMLANIAGLGIAILIHSYFPIFIPMVLVMVWFVVSLIRAVR